MPKMRTRFTLCAIVLCAAASFSCTSPAPGEIVAGEVGLHVEFAREESSVAGQHPGDGEMFVLVQARVGNGLEAGVFVTPGSFRLLTSDGLERLATPISSLLGDACPTDALLSAGRTISCAIAFAVPSSAVPQELILASASEGSVPMPVRAVAPIDGFRRCQRCAGECTDLSSDPDNCGACGRIAPSRTCTSGEGECTDGQIECDGSCVNPNSSILHCGGCGQGFANGFCHDGVPSCAPGRAGCDGRCVNVMSDRNNCGACGVRVAEDEGSCQDGEVRCYYPLGFCDGACVPLQYDPDHCGGCGLQCPEGFMCRPEGGPTCLGSTRPTTVASCDDTCAARGGRCRTAEYSSDSTTWEIACSRAEDPARVSCICEVAPS